MCYGISTGLFDTNIRRLYMYDKPGQLCQPPHKSRMADCIFFTKENVFCTILCRPLASQLAGWHMDSCIKIKHIYV